MTTLITELIQLSFERAATDRQMLWCAYIFHPDTPTDASCCRAISLARAYLLSRL